MPLGKKLANTDSRPDRRRILKEALESIREDIERLNGGIVLDLEEMEGIKIADLVEYTNALGTRTRGYVSHFFARTQNTIGFAFAESLTSFTAQKDERVYQSSRGDIFPVIIPVGSDGYSTAHGNDPVVLIR